MSYIRTVKTSSGATAVQILTKYHGEITKIDHIGSAHSKSELNKLLKEAKQKLKDPDQGSLF